MYPHLRMYPPPEDFPEHDDPHQTMPPPQQPDTFDFDSLQAWMIQHEQRAHERAMRQEIKDNHMIDQQATIFRSNQGIYSHLYDAHMDPRCFTYTPTQFYDSCMWPGDRPIYPEGGSAAGPAHTQERTASFHGISTIGPAHTQVRTASFHTQERTASFHGADHDP
jgi:hypothetical protein